MELSNMPHPDLVIITIFLASLRFSLTCPNVTLLRKHALAIISFLDKQNLVTLVRERTIPTKRPPLVGKVSSNFLRIEGATWSV
jgi:hypothetical protein